MTPITIRLIATSNHSVTTKAITTAASVPRPIAITMRLIECVEPTHHGARGAVGRGPCSDSLFAMYQRRTMKAARRASICSGRSSFSLLLIVAYRYVLGMLSNLARRQS